MEIPSAFNFLIFLQLDSTKTTDGKKTFLDKLVQLIHENSPELLSISEELNLVPAAEKGMQLSNIIVIL